MSVKLMGQVWEMELPRGEQLVMLALADHGEDDGSQIFPSVARLAWKTGYKERQVQNILRSLEAKGLIEAVAYPQGGRGHATEFKMNLEKGAKKTPYVKGAKSERVQNPAQRVQSSTPKGAKSSTKGAIAIAPQPSYNHQLESSIEPSREAASASPPPPPEPVRFEDIPQAPPEVRPTAKPTRARPSKPVLDGTANTPTSQQALVGALAEATGMATRLNGSRLGKAAAQLARVEATADLVRQHYGPGGWWYQCDWRGQKGEFPRPEQVIETWGQWERAAPPNGNGKPPGKGRHSEAWQKLAEGPTMIDLRLERERKAEEERRRQYGIK